MPLDTSLTESSFLSLKAVNRTVLEQEEKRSLTAKILNKNKPVATEFPGSPSAEQETWRENETKQDLIKLIQLADGRESSSHHLIFPPAVERVPTRRGEGKGTGTVKEAAGLVLPARGRQGKNKSKLK